MYLCLYKEQVMDTKRLSSSPEALLIDMMRRGSTHAFDELYRMYVHRLLGFCLQICKTREDAEEIVQDTFVQLWKHRDRIRQSESLKSLLFTIARNRIVNAYRSLANSACYEDYVEHWNILAGEDSSAKLSYQEFVQQLEETLTELPATQSKVVRLSRLEDKNNKEIAQILSLSEQSVKNQLSLGLKALRVKLQARGYLGALFFLSFWDF